MTLQAELSALACRDRAGQGRLALLPGRASSASSTSSTSGSPRRPPTTDQAAISHGGTAEGRRRQASSWQASRPARRQCRPAGRGTPALPAGQAARDKAQRELEHTSSRRRSTASSPMCPRCSPATICSRRARPSAWSRPTMSGSPASPKETELTYVEPGQNGDDRRSTPIPAHAWNGTVESISPASARASRCCRRRTPAATGSRSSSASRCASTSTTAGQAAAARRHERRGRCRHRPCPRPADSSPACSALTRESHG